MNAIRAAAVGSDTMLDDIAAELTQSAYDIAHTHLTEFHGVQPPWLELKLALWSALRRIVKKWDHFSQSLAAPELADRREDYLVELADAVYRTMLRFCVRESFREVESNLHQSFRMMIESKERACRRRGNAAGYHP